MIHKGFVRTIFTLVSHPDFVGSTKDENEQFFPLHDDLFQGSKI